MANGATVVTVPTRVAIAEAVPMAAILKALSSIPRGCRGLTELNFVIAIVITHRPRTIWFA